MKWLEAMEAAIREDSSSGTKREELKAVQQLDQSGNISALKVRVKKLEDTKAEKGTASSIGTLSAEKSTLQSTINGKADPYDVEKVKTRLNAMWKTLYETEPKPVNAWSGFHAKLWKNSITGVSASATALSVGVTGCAIAFRGSYLCLGIKSKTFNGANLKLKGVELSSVLLSTFSGIYGLWCLGSAYKRVSNAKVTVITNVNTATTTAIEPFENKV